MAAGLSFCLLILGGLAYLGFLKPLAEKPPAPSPKTVVKTPTKKRIEFWFEIAKHEPYLMLPGILAAQEQFRISTRFYAATRADGSGNARGGEWVQYPCPSNCSSITPKSCNTFLCLPFEPPGETYFRYACETHTPERSSKPEVTCAAVADLDGDGQFKMLVLGTANHYPATRIMADIPAIGDPGTCAVGKTPAGEVIDCHPDEW